MPIIGLQRSFSEVGRIRLGERKGTRPSKLETFRLTSPDKTRIEAAAKLYGGTVEEWPDAPAGKQWQVVTETDTIPVLVPPVPDMVFSQWYELWSGGGCQRRCDEKKEWISEGPCLCDPAARQCTPHTRLSVLLPELPGLGVWRLDTQGWNAAKTLGLSVDNIIKIYDRRGDMLPATLRLDQRVSKKVGKTTMRYVVPVLDVTQSPNELFRQRELTAGESGGKAPLTPIPESSEPVPSIAEQTAQVQAIEPRRRSKPEMQATGVSPRTATQTQQTTQPAQVEPAQPTAESLEDPELDAIEAKMEEEERRNNCDTPINVEAQDHETVPVDDEGQPVIPEPDESVARVSMQQLEKLSTLMRDAGLLKGGRYTLDKESRRCLIVSMIDRDIENPSDLTEGEGNVVITAFESDPLVGARYKLDLLLMQSGFDDIESQRGFISAGVERDAGVEDLSDDEIIALLTILESDQNA